MNLLSQWTWRPDLVVRVVSQGVLVAERDGGVGVSDCDEVSAVGMMSVVIGDPSM